MNVDLNNVRRQLVYAHDRLIKRLNSNINNGRLIVDIDDISSDLNEMRMLIATMAFSYLPDNPELIDLSNEIDTLEVFNPENEDESN